MLEIKLINSKETAMVLTNIKVTILFLIFSVIKVNSTEVSSIKLNSQIMNLITSEKRKRPLVLVDKGGSLDEAAKNFREKSIKLHLKLFDAGIKEHDAQKVAAAIFKLQKKDNQSPLLVIKEIEEVFYNKIMLEAKKLSNLSRVARLDFCDPENPNVAKCETKEIEPEATKNKNKKNKRKLKQAGIQDQRGNTELHRAIKASKYDTIQRLLKLECNCNVKNKLGHLPLHIAASKTYSKTNFSLLKIILEHTDDHDAKTNKGWTALHVAASRGNKVFVDFLIEQGANKEAVTELGETYLKLAKKYAESSSIA